jgi:voltage-gated potassium channel
MIGGVATSRRTVIGGSIRAVVLVAAILAAYFALPFTRLSTLPTWLLLLVGVVAIVALVVREVWAITHHSLPWIRAVTAVCVLLPAYLCWFAAAYKFMEERDPTAFSEHLSRVDALYFSVTMFSTVGFGDIVATSPAARLAVTGQIVANLIMLGVGVRVIIGAAQRREPFTPPGSS